MIKVICDACEKSFQAKDALAGRKGKCPSCGEPIVVPEAGPAAPAGSAAPAAAPVRRAAAPTRAPAASSSRAPVAGGGSSRRGGTRRRSSGGGQANRIMGIVGIVAVLAVGGFFMFGGGDEGGGGGSQSSFQQGLDAMSGGRLEDAIKFFEEVPATARMYALAQENLTESRERLAAQTSMTNSKRANVLYSIIKRIEQDAEREGSTGPRYVPLARYMLKRCRDFVSDFNSDPRATEIGQYAYVWSEVASLDTPPTYADVDEELTWRLFGPAPAFDKSLEAINEYAASASADPEGVARLRQRVKDYTVKHWSRVKSELESGGDLDAGSENWQRVANMTQRYINLLDGLEGLKPTDEAIALLARAEAGGG